MFPQNSARYFARAVDETLAIYTSAGKDLLSIPHADTRYRGDVIRQKRRQKTSAVSLTR